VDALSKSKKIAEQTQESLVKMHASMVKRMAYQLLAKLPKSMQLDDLIQAGMLGLLEAVRNYNASRGASFETYASIRIRGNMLDEVRKSGWVPRSVYRNSRLVSQAVKTVENRLGRESKDSEVAEELNLDLEEYYELLQDSAGSQLYGFEDLGLTDDQLIGSNKNQTEPQEKILHDDLLQYINQALTSLSKNQRMVLSLYYEKDFNLKEIGEILGISESRACQINTEATTKIRQKLAEEFA
jgi:RNA polymerase sigma factor for flagellar operon FliA